MDDNSEDHANGYPSYPYLEDQATESTEYDKSSATSTNDHAQLPSLPGTNDFDFWKVNSYKKTVKRIDDGSRMCDDLMKMVSERSEIESQYSAKLQGKKTDFVK